MAKAAIRPDEDRQSFHRPVLPEGENERLAMMAVRGVRAIGALFRASLDGIRMLEATTHSAHDETDRRTLSYIGFKKAVLCASRNGHPGGFLKHAQRFVRQSLTTGSAVRTLDEYENADFIRRFVSGRATRKLKPHVVRKLVIIAQDGDRAVQTLIPHNAGLVVELVRRMRSYQYMEDDLLSEGMVGLHKAILRFEPRFGCKLSTYAVVWIRQNIGRYVANNKRNVRVPVHTQEREACIRKAENAFSERAFRSGDRCDRPDVSTISAATGISTKNVLAAIETRAHEASLDQPFEGEVTGTLGAILADDGLPADAALMSRERTTQLEQLLRNVLTDNERRILHERFYEDRTLKDVGEDYSVSRERIRQLQNQACAKLRPYLLRAGIE